MEGKCIVGKSSLTTNPDKGRTGKRKVKSYIRTERWVDLWNVQDELPLHNLNMDFESYNLDKLFIHRNQNIYI